jgi:hypothetical protein
MVGFPLKITSYHHSYQSIILVYIQKKYGSNYPSAHYSAITKIPNSINFIEKPPNPKEMAVLYEKERMGTMRRKTEYKSPYAAAVWSMVLPGFGQLYNKDYIIGFVLLGFEFLINIYSNLNLALVYSFTGDFARAHSVIDYSWGMFYPSLYAFSIWQAFNAAKANNARTLDRMVKLRSYYTGFFIGLVVGMDLGLFWHDFPYLNKFKVLSILNLPVFSGLTFGLLLAFLGNYLEKTIYRKKKAAHELV